MDDSTADPANDTGTPAYMSPEQDDLAARRYAFLRANGVSRALAAAQVGAPRPRPLAKTHPRQI